MNHSGIGSRLNSQELKQQAREDERARAADAQALESDRQAAEAHPKRHNGVMDGAFAAGLRSAYHALAGRNRELEDAGLTPAIDSLLNMARGEIDGLRNRDSSVDLGHAAVRLGEAYRLQRQARAPAGGPRDGS